jgi:hypothetical protein
LEFAFLYVFIITLVYCFVNTFFKENIFLFPLKKVSGLFATGRVSLTYLTETMVHIYIPQPRGDLAVEVIGLGLTWLL